MPHKYIAQVDTIYGYTSFQSFEAHPRPRRLIGQVLQDWLAPKEESWERKYFLCIKIEQDRKKQAPIKKRCLGKIKFNQNSKFIYKSKGRLTHGQDPQTWNLSTCLPVTNSTSEDPLPKGPLVINGAVPAIIWGTKFYFRASFKMQFSFWVTFEYSVRGMARWQKAVM